MLKRMLAAIARCHPLYRELLQIRDSLHLICTDIRRIDVNNMRETLNLIASDIRRIDAEIGGIRRDICGIREMEAIRCYDLELERHPRYGEPCRLHRYAFQVNSQNGEDGIIHEIFRRIETSNRVFVEVGVGDGKESNTAFLLSQGWSGYWFDASDAFLRSIEARREFQNGCLTPCVSAVDKENIAALFERLGVPRQFDLLSLDIDQNTFHIWEALRAFTPRVVVAEYNAAIPPDIDWKVQYVAERAWDGTQNFGASLKAFEKLGSQLGYSLVGCDFNGVNAFFVRNELASDKFVAPFTAENHYEPPRYQFIHRRGHPRAILDTQQPG